MRKSRIRAKFECNEPALLVTLHLTDASLYEMASLMGIDGIWMDLEHHGFSIETATSLMRAARVGTADIMARPAKGEFMRMARLLEAGAQGILYPRCESAEEAREVVRNAKFAPEGIRGVDGGNPDCPYCLTPTAEYLRQANEQTWIAVQVEDQAAVDRAEEMAAVEGIDAIFFGPGDYSASQGIAGQVYHERVQAAMEQVARAAANAGKHWGMPAFSVEHGKMLIEKGARLISFGADIIMVQAALRKNMEDFAKLGVKFGNGEQ